MTGADEIEIANSERIISAFGESASPDPAEW
jgi:hypothetical protein